MQDQNGRPVFSGDTVTITGKVTDLLDDPNYINCTVQLDQPLPPSGAQMSVNLNTRQVVKQGAADPPYVQPLPLTVGRLEAIRSARQAAILDIYLEIGEIKNMAEQLAQLQKMQQ